jgi:thiol-disulfide isomerase/thioredoxin
MDRLPAVIAALALVACEDPPAGEPTSRVNAGKATAQKGATVEAFCDVYTPAAKAQPLAWPALTTAAPAPASSWRWINVWASWCKPCIEEMPRLQKWRTKLSVGRTIDLAFVSVDESEADLAAHRKDHADTPPTLRLADSKQQEAWYDQLGLKSPTIPIHIFVDPANRVRCVRSGGVREQDYAIVEKLLSSN